jgi:predicted XRE-type DNA-binding protein
LTTVATGDVAKKDSGHRGRLERIILELIYRVGRMRNLRVVYVAKFEKAVYVLHTFQKKSPSRWKTDQTEVDAVERVFRSTEELQEDLPTACQAMNDELEVAPSAGKVFVDLRVPNPADEDTKMDLAVAINDAIEDRGLRQAEATKLIGAAQPQVSALANCRLSGFSIGRLVDFLTALGRDVEIGYRVTKSGEPGHVRVRALDAAAADV